MSHTNSTSAHEAPYPQRWPALFVLLLAGFMNLIDVTIVNVALPRLQAGLGATSSEIEWVIAAYVLAFALGLLPFGRLGDQIGRRRMFIAGVSLFTLFSAACGMAPTMNTLIIARILQGFSSAMMMPQVLAIVQVIFPPNERPTAFSLFGLSAGLASVAGPLTGGLLIGADIFGLDWRPIFLVNIPVGILTVIAALAVVPSSVGDARIRHDVGGIALAGVAVVLLIFPLVEGHAYGWPAWTFIMIGLAVIGFASFYLFESARARVGYDQLLPVELMRNGNFLLGTGMTLVFFSGVAGFFMVLAVFLQTGFGLTPLQSGLTTLPFPVGVLVASLISGRLGRRWPRQRIAVGALVLIIGMSIMRYVVSGVGEVVDHWAFVPPLFLSGLGMGLGISSLFQTVLATVPPRDAGAGSGALQSFQQIGSAIGVAIAGQIFFSSLETSFKSGSMPHPAFIGGLESALIYELVAFALVIVLVLFIKAPAQGQAGPFPRNEGQPVLVEA